MNATRDAVEQIVLARIARLNATLSGLVAGMICGLGLFVATNWLVLKGGTVVGPHLQLLGQYFIGYRVTFLGSLIGFVYAFISGFVVDYLVATLYNVFAQARDRRRQPRRLVRG
jgi:hypothetical protein